jgi:hypothetical protein
MRRGPGLPKVIKEIAVMEECPFEMRVFTQLSDDVPLDGYERYLKKTP